MYNSSTSLSIHGFLWTSTTIFSKYSPAFEKDGFFSPEGSDPMRIKSASFALADFALLKAAKERRHEKCSFYSDIFQDGFILNEITVGALSTTQSCP